jgi:hypothetical protein
MPDLEHCHENREIVLLRSGHPDVEGLLPALLDRLAKRQLL